MTRYLCCDPRYPEGTPPDALLTKTFYAGPRFVAAAVVVGAGSSALALASA